MRARRRCARLIVGGDMVVCGKIDLREPINGMPELWWLMTLPEVALLTQRCVDGVPE